MEPRYTTEETSRCQKNFAPVANRYRRHTRTAIAAVIGFFCCILLLLLFRPSAMGWGFLVPAVVFWVIALGATLSAPALACPACKERLDRDLGRYCPECGSTQLEAGDFVQASYCLSCRRQMRRHKGRTRLYTIRACTHCGLMLNERGF